MKAFTLTIVALFFTSTSEAATAWIQHANSDDGKLHATLKCEHAPKPGPFQNCTLNLVDAQQQALAPAHIDIQGGMPAHGHGLPTAPQATATEQAGEYAIKGLKFSMPGEWVLDALIQHKGERRHIRFEFDI